MTIGTGNVPATHMTEHASEDALQAFFDSTLNDPPPTPMSDEEWERLRQHYCEPPIIESRFDYWAACTECGGRDGWRNIGRTHWCYCDIHRQKWCVGWNLTSDWRDENDTRWEENAAYLADYRDIRN